MYINIMVHIYYINSIYKGSYNEDRGINREWDETGREMK